jgi:GT2 family glycosyltransferase
VREFDESLGLGANTPFLSGEETDLLIRILKAGFKIFYSNKTIVFHAEPTKEYTSKAISRAYNYGCGCGHVLKKHNYSNLFKIKFLARPLAGVLLSLAACKLHKANYHFNVLKGRFRGLFQEFY